MHSFSWSFPSSSDDSTTSAKKGRMKGKPKTSRNIQIDRVSIFFANKSLKRRTHKNHSDEMDLPYAGICLCMPSILAERGQRKASQV
jgi:hypothetical protein